MSFVKRAGLAAIVLMALAAYPAQAAGPARDRRWPSLAEIDADVTADSVGYRLLGDLTRDIGPRMTGSARGARAEAFALAQFRAIGLKHVRFEPFALERWERGPLQFRVAGRPVAAVAFGGSPARAGFDAGLVDLSNGTQADYDARPGMVLGRVVLVYYTVLPGSAASTEHLYRWDKIKLAIRHGARAIVFINRGEGNVLATGTGWRDGSLPLPVLLVGHDDGLRLKAALTGGALPAHIEMRNTVGPGSARNVVGVLPGSDPSASEIVFGAHLDSWDLATGALDNGASAMTLIDVARLFVRHGYRPRHTIRFVLFMGEEQGDLGSKAAVAAAVANGGIDRLGYMVDTDMSYDPVALNTWGLEVDKGFFGDLAAAIHARHPKLSSEPIAIPMPGGDVDPYLWRGLPVLYLNGDQSPEFERCQHADCDRLDIIHPAQMIDSARVEAMVLFSLANARDLPARPMSGDALDQYLTRYHLKP
jgi:carboxypeptidase Q